MATNTQAEDEAAFKIRAEKGNADAQYQMGLFSFRKGDDRAGLEWLEKAAAQDSASAVYNLGKCYDDGKRVSVATAVYNVVLGALRQAESV